VRRFSSLHVRFVLLVFLAMLPLVGLLAYTYLDPREQAIAIGDNDRLALMLAAVLLAFATAWFVTDFLIVQRVQALLQAADRLRAGDLTARAPTLPGLSNWSQLAGAFNRMASALQEHEKQLRQEESKFRTLVEQLPALAYLSRLDATSSPLYISPQVELILGIPPPEWLADQESWVKHLHPDDRPRVLAELEQCHASGVPFCSEYRLITRDGRAIWFLDQGVIVRDQKGNPLFMQGVLNDISEHIEAESALRESEERLDALFQASPIPTFVYRRQNGGFVLTDYNRAALEVTGQNIERFLDKPADVLLAGRHDLAELMNRSFETHETMYLSTLHRLAPTGADRVLNFSFAFVPPDGVIVQMQDITEQKLVEVALQEQAHLLDLTHDAIFVRDMSKRVVFWNRGAEELYGWTKEQALGQVTPELLRTEFSGAIEEIEEKIAREGRWEGELVHTRRDGRRIAVASRWSLQRDSAGHPVAILETNNDITERKTAEDMLRRVNAELEQRVEERTAKLNEANAALLNEIAEHAHAEDALRASELRFRLLAENARDLIYRYRLGPEPRFEYVSPSATAITGYTPEEHYADPELGLKLVHPEDRTLFQNTLRGEINPDAPLVLRWTRKDGSIIWTEQVNTPIHDASGNLVAIEGIARDITERRRAEEELAQANERLRSRANEVEQRNREFAMLNAMGDLLESCLTVQEAYSVIAQSAGKLFTDNNGVLYVIAGGRNLAESVATWGNLPAETVDPVLTLDDCWALRRGRTHVVQDLQSGIVCQHVQSQQVSGSLESYTCVPMVAQSELLGVLHLESRTGSLPEARQRLAVTVAEHLALALSSLRLREKLQQQAIRDPLTGLFNRRYLTESLERELRRAQRRESEVGIIMLDLDHFKQINDNYGHDVGDAFLRTLGEYLQKHVREEDIVCRYGGEEFTLILPEATLERARERAEQLCEGIARLTVQYENQSYGNISASFGVAAFPQQGTTPEAVLKAADAALAQAKLEGRNRVILAEGKQVTN
jgi:diguanylate cyclase (GGDEF)-like protein/PAS domain S-box-containing protein